jgi:hypothetical protein
LQAAGKIFNSQTLGYNTSETPELKEDLMHAYPYEQTVMHTPLPHTQKSYSKLSQTNMHAAFSQKFWSFMFSSENCATKLH